MATTDDSGGRPSRDERIAQADQALQDELTRIVESGEYETWFAKMASFHRYSAANAARILAQKPDATRVASFRTWRQLERHVVKGEHGLLVFHPKPYWIDPDTGDKVPPPKSAREPTRAVRKVTFGVGYVFDVSQTDGKPLPSLGRPAPERAPAALTAHLDRYCRDNGIRVDTKDLVQDLYGFYQRAGDRIVLAASSTGGERVATLAHELAHREDPVLADAHEAGDTSYYRHHRVDCEAVAEAAAHTISARFGFDITGQAAGYIAGWVRGDVDRLAQLGQRVGQVTQRLVPPDRLDAVLDAAHARAAIAATRRQHQRRTRRRSRP